MHKGTLRPQTGTQQLFHTGSYNYRVGGCIGGYLIAPIHSLNHHKTLRYLTRKPKGRGILARGPASVGPARGPKLNTKDSSRKGLSAKDLSPRGREPRSDFVVNSFLSARERQGRAQECGLEGGPHPPVSSSLHPASPGSDRLGEAQERGRFCPVPPVPACRRAGLRPPHLPRRLRSPWVTPRCESRGARNAKGRERRAAGWAPGPRPSPRRLARPPSCGPSSQPRGGGQQPRSVRGGREAGCACPAWGGAILLYGQAGSATAVTRGLGDPALGAKLHRVFVWKG